MYLQNTVAVTGGVVLVSAASPAGLWAHYNIIVILTYLLILLHIANSE